MSRFGELQSFAGSAPAGAAGGALTGTYPNPTILGTALLGNAATLASGKFIFNGGTRLKVTTVTDTYQVLTTDDVVSVGTISVGKTVTLPASATVGDTYTIKDHVGEALTRNITVAGNGVNIDGAATYVIATNYGHLCVVRTSAKWSIVGTL